MIDFSLFVQNDHFWWTVALVDTLSSGSWSLCCVELQGCIVSCFGWLDSLHFLAANTSSCTSKDSFLNREEKQFMQFISASSHSQYHTTGVTLLCITGVNVCKNMCINWSCSSSDTSNMALEDTLWQVWCQKRLPLVLTCHLLHCFFMYCMWTWTKLKTMDCSNPINFQCMEK